MADVAKKFTKYFIANSSKFSGVINKMVAKPKEDAVKATAISKIDREAQLSRDRLFKMQNMGSDN